MRDYNYDYIPTTSSQKRNWTCSCWTTTHVWITSRNLAIQVPTQTYRGETSLNRHNIILLHTIGFDNQPSISVGSLRSMQQVRLYRLTKAPTLIEVARKKRMLKKMILSSVIHTEPHRQKNPNNQHVICEEQWVQKSRLPGNAQHHQDIIGTGGYLFEMPSSERNQHKEFC